LPAVRNAVGEHEQGPGEGVGPAPGAGVCRNPPSSELTSLEGARPFVIFVAASRYCSLDSHLTT
jgi:hypothetical protein